MPMSSEEFDRTYRMVPKTTEDGELLRELEEVTDHDPHHVWTVVEGGERDALYAVPGLHRVNRVGYVVTEVAWSTGQEEAFYLEPDAIART